MSEIWGSEVNEIPGFDMIAISLPRKLNTKKYGRSSGAWYFSGRKKIPYTIFFPHKSNVRLYMGKNRLKYSSARQRYSIMFMLYSTKSFIFF